MTIDQEIKTAAAWAAYYWASDRIYLGELDSLPDLAYCETSYERLSAQAQQTLSLAEYRDKVIHYCTF